jgi:hypothetical protein
MFEKNSGLTNFTSWNSAKIGYINPKNLIQKFSHVKAYINIKLLFYVM